MKNFVVLGVGGYVAERHLRAVLETGNRVVAAVDPHDSVGILDAHFPDARYFRDLTALSDFIHRSGERVDFVSVCSPSDLHVEHCCFGLSLGANVICEKPLALGKRELDVLERAEADALGALYTVLQLRVMPSLVEMERRLRTERATATRERSLRRARVKLEYVTRRGPWYHESWKGQPARSGGLAMNIGIHLFDLLLWLFGPPRASRILAGGPSRIRGELGLEHADVSWLLSVDGADLPASCRERNQSAYRALEIDGVPLEFSSGFETLHTMIYREALAGRGHGVRDVRPAIELAEQIAAESAAEPSRLG